MILLSADFVVIVIIPPSWLNESYLKNIRSVRLQAGLCLSQEEAGKAV